MKITIQRKKQWVDLARRYDIWINDKKIGIIKSGESKNIDIDHGDSLRFSVDWCSSKELNSINDNEIIEIYNPINDFYIGISLIFTSILFFIGLKNNNLIWNFSAFIFLIYPMVKLTVEKKNYLKIKIQKKKLSPVVE